MSCQFALVNHDADIAIGLGGYTQVTTAPTDLDHALIVV